MDPYVALLSIAKAHIPQKFTDFCDWIGFKLYPGQRVLCKVAFDGVDPIDLQPEERAMARKLFGPIDRIPPDVRRTVVIVIGARAGKTRISATRVLHLALTIPAPFLAPGEKLYSVLVTPEPRTRAQALDYVKGVVQSVPELAALLVREPNAERVLMRRPDGREVSIEVIPAKQGGLAGRGRNLAGVVMDECAFFMDENKVISDREVWDALAPRVIAGGQAVLSSTPYLETGILFEAFVQNHPDPSCASPHLQVKGAPTWALAAHAPTLDLRDVEETRAVVAASYAQDPIKASREYGAQFITVGTKQFFPGDVLVRQVGDVSGVGPTVVAVDVALKNDRTGIAVVRRLADNRIVVPHVEEMAPPLVPSAVAARAIEVARQWGAEALVGDAVYEGVMKEACAAADLPFVLVPPGQAGKAEIFTATKVALLESQLWLLNDDRLLSQLRSVTSKELPGGGLSIELPRTDKGHCDSVSALCAGVWYAKRYLVPPKEEKPADQMPALERWLTMGRSRTLKDEDLGFRQRRQVQKRDFGERWWR